MLHTLGSDGFCIGCALKLKDAHPELDRFFREYVLPKYSRAHISWSFRGEEDQEQAYRDGKSKLHWPHSPHNQKPSLAIDLFEIDENGRAKWDPKFFAMIAQEAVIHGLPIVWGGSWKSIGDTDHFELTKELEGPIAA